MEFLETRQSDGSYPVHVINIDIPDNQEEATIGAFLICDMVAMVKFNYRYYLLATNKKGENLLKKEKQLRLYFFVSTDIEDFFHPTLLFVIFKLKL